MVLAASAFWGGDACGAQPDDTKDTFLIVSDSSESWWDDFRNTAEFSFSDKSVKSGLGRYRGQFEFSVTSVSSQIKVLKTVQAGSGHAGVAIAPVDAGNEELLSELRRIRKSGIPVVLLKRDVAPALRDELRDAVILQPPPEMFAFHLRKAMVNAYFHTMPDDESKSEWTLAQLLTSKELGYETHIADAIINPKKAEFTSSAFTFKEIYRHRNCGDKQSVKEAFRKIVDKSPDIVIAYSALQAQELALLFDGIPESERPQLVVASVSLQLSKLVEEDKVVFALGGQPFEFARRSIELLHGLRAQDGEELRSSLPEHGEIATSSLRVGHYDDGDFSRWSGLLFPDDYAILHQVRTTGKVDK